MRRLRPRGTGSTTGPLGARRAAGLERLRCSDRPAPDGVHYIVDGSVSVVIEDDDGREIVLAYLFAGDFFGETGLFDEKDGSSAWVVARTECQLAEMSHAQFRLFSGNHPDLLYAIAAQMAARLRKTGIEVRDVAFLDVTARIASTLLDLAKMPDAITHPDGMQIRITRREIARIAGCSRGTAGRVLKEFEERGLIHTRRETMVIYGTR